MKIYLIVREIIIIPYITKRIYGFMNNTLVSKQLSMGVLRLSCLELFLLEQKKLNTQILYTCCQINKIMTVIANSFQEVLNWAINPFKNGRTHTLNKTKELTITKQRNIAQKDEKEWGNQIIGQKNNGNWTTLLGQGIVFETLKKLGENPRKPEKKKWIFTRLGNRSIYL